MTFDDFCSNPASEAYLGMYVTAWKGGGGGGGGTERDPEQFVGFEISFFLWKEKSFKMFSWFSDFAEGLHFSS